ncbi:MAG TPA: methyltransferase type 11, partial [Sphingomicrobium sp.]|nr:methyltransferase type 11 [Sphingomicrobium sp.]
MIRHAAALLLLSVAAPLAAQPAADPASPAASMSLDAAIAAPTRTPANIARDKYRHPAETLAFFGVKPGDSVVELWPGGGWYTEILAPYLATGGTLHVVPPTGQYAERIRTKIA